MSKTIYEKGGFIEQTIEQYYDETAGTIFG